MEYLLCQKKIYNLVLNILNNCRIVWIVNFFNCKLNFVSFKFNGAKSDPANYRPISLTCLCCKIMEHVVLSHIAKHLNANSILLDSQHGFREKLSTVTRLITSCHDWASTLQSRGQTNVVLLDFSKAFVPHHHLSAKLSYYGIRGPTLEWIRSFLNNRFRAVSVNGSHSSWGK